MRNGCCGLLTTLCLCCSFLSMLFLCFRVRSLTQDTALVAEDHWGNPKVQKSMGLLRYICEPCESWSRTWLSHCPSHLRRHVVLMKVHWLERGNILLVLWGRHCRVHSFFTNAIGFKSGRDVMIILNTGRAYQKIQPRDAGPKEPDWDDSVLRAICLFLEISKLSLKFWLETFTLFDKQVIIHSQKSSKILVYEN